MTIVKIDIPVMADLFARGENRNTFSGLVVPVLSMTDIKKS
ncbi:MAG: hypothetical protein ACOXZO_12070 [Bacteroidales bacterium]